MTDSTTTSHQADIALLVKAADFAARRHTTQRRKNDEQIPYINHPLGVAFILSNEGNVTDSATLAAAMLHDTVEDTETSLEEILEHFGPEVHRIVAECTDDKSLPVEVRKQLQIDDGPSHCRPARLVHLADKLYNLRDTEKRPPIGWEPERIREYWLWARRVVGALKGTHSGLEAILEELFARNIRE